MRAASHLLFNIFVVSALSFLLYYLYGWNILTLNPLYLFIAVYVFSNLPDIDNSNSNMSRTFFLGYILMIIAGIFLVFTETVFANQLIGAGLSVTGILAFVFHLSVAENSKQHRKLPHTYTFGILASFILFLFTSLDIAVIGFLCFFLHLLMDGYLLKAFEKDVYYWRKLFGIIRV